GKQTSRDYMLSPERVFCRAMASELESRGLVRMEFAPPTARGLRVQPCLLWRSSGVAGVHRRTSRHIRPRELIVRLQLFFGSIINEANEPSSACRLWRISQVETSTPPATR